MLLYVKINVFIITRVHHMLLMFLCFADAEAAKESFVESCQHTTSARYESIMHVTGSGEIRLHYITYDVAFKVV